MAVGALVSPSRCKQKSETEAVITALRAVCVRQHKKIYLEAVITLNSRSLCAFFLLQ